MRLYFLFTLLGICCSSVLYSQALDGYYPCAAGNKWVYVHWRGVGPSPGNSYTYTTTLCDRDSIVVINGDTLTFLVQRYPTAGIDYYDRDSDAVYYWRGDTIPPYLRLSFRWPVGYKKIDWYGNSYMGTYVASIRDSNYIGILNRATSTREYIRYQHQNLDTTIDPLDWTGLWSSSIYAKGVGLISTHNFEDEHDELACCIINGDTLGSKSALTDVAVDPTVSNTTLDVWPVPAHDVLHFRSRTTQPLTIQIVNACGQIVRTLPIVPEHATLSIPTNIFPNGVYSVVFSNGTSKQAKTIIIDK